MDLSNGVSHYFSWCLGKKGCPCYLARRKCWPDRAFDMRVSIYAQNQARNSILNYRWPKQTVTFLFPYIFRALFRAQWYQMAIFPSIFDPNFEETVTTQYKQARNRTQNWARNNLYLKEYFLSFHWNKKSSSQGLQGSWLFLYKYLISKSSKFA